MTNRHIINRALPERSKLMFYFPMPQTGDSYYTVELPFFENVSIKESKKARYQKYSLISRSSNLYSYLGADSRMLDITFNITLPHLLEEHPDINLDRYVGYLQDKDNTELEKQKFLEPYKQTSIPDGAAWKLGTTYTTKFAKASAQQVLNTDWALAGITASERVDLKTRYQLDDPLPNNDIIAKRVATKEFADGSLIGDDVLVTDVDTDQTRRLKYRIIDLIIYWTNIIRSSVVNYSKNPIYGPPIIRLNHGILYQNIPCICENYSIDYNEAAGHDLDTLLPRQLKVTLKLEEIRTGDFGEFVPKGNPIERDNLAGWEAVVLGETNSMDPGY
jgi:hypothetical protein